MTETWALIFYVTGTLATPVVGPATMEGFKDRQACMDTALQIEQAWSIKWICIHKGGKPEDK